MTYDVAVVGGGPAGAATALSLARRGANVLLLEKRRLPAHKLCGEFLSVEVQGIFKRLGVADAVCQAGARPIWQTYVTTAGGASFRNPLPGAALGLSRYVLDELLFDQARAAGAEAIDRTPVRSISGSLREGFRIGTDRADYRAQVVVGAYGRRSTLDRKLDRGVLHANSPFVGFKAHFEGLSLGETIELHAFDGGYCGLVEVEGGRINACWITRDFVLKRAGGRPQGIVDTAFKQNPVLAERFAELRRVGDSYEAVSQISFARKPLFSGDVLMVGDSAAMIAPLCGDGMAMALTSAELAAPLVDAFLREDVSRKELLDLYAGRWDTAFASRLRIGRWIHRGYVRPRLAEPAVRVLDRLPRLADWLIAATRG